MEMDHSNMLYHESQEAALCGVHCLNTLLQGPFFSEIDLGQISQDLDAKEREMMAAGGTEGDDFKRFLAEGSHNAAADGMFSIQVLETALKIWGLTCISIDSPSAGSAAKHPENEEAFILNLQEHWFTIRKACGGWWNFNSLSPAPRTIVTFLSECIPGNNARTRAREANIGASKARQTGYAKALLSNLAEKSSTEGTFVPLRPRLGGDEDADLARAIAASLAQSSGALSGSAQDGGVMDSEDSDLAKAIAASLEDASCIPLPTQPAWVDPGPEPAPGPGVLDIAVRFPDGARKIRRFQKSDPIASLINFVGWNGVDMTKHVLSRQFPRQVLGEASLSLAAAGLDNMETIVVDKGL